MDERISEKKMERGNPQGHKVHNSSFGGDLTTWEGRRDEVSVFSEKEPCRRLDTAPITTHFGRGLYELFAILNSPRTCAP